MRVPLPGSWLLGQPLLGSNRGVVEVLVLQGTDFLTLAPIAQTCCLWRWMSSVAAPPLPKNPKWVACSPKAEGHILLCLLPG